MKKRDERTSARVAKIAGRVLRMDPFGIDWRLADGSVWLTWEDIRALAASALTQAPDRFGFSHWGNPPEEKPGPRRPVHRVEFDDSKPPTTKRKNGVVKKGRFATRNPKGLKRTRVISAKKPTASGEEHKALIAWLSSKPKVGRKK